MTDLARLAAEIDLEGLKTQCKSVRMAMKAPIMTIEVSKTEELSTAIEALRERVFVADTEVTRLQTANSHWHLRISKMKTDAAAAEGRVAKLEEIVSELETKIDALEDATP